MRDRHPDQVLEPLDATAPTDLALAGPTVIIEIVGAREALDALLRVRRVAADAPVAAVRVAPADPTPSASRRHLDLRSGAAILVIAVCALGAILAARWGSPVVSTVITVAVLVLAPVLAVAAVVWLRRVRRAPMVRRRYFERRRSIAVIAVASPDPPAALSLASSVRRELETARSGDGHYDVRVFEPVADPPV
ncbi:MAG: hypothetical protein U0Q03_07225 [Acidimicrobiales bacterium]